MNNQLINNLKKEELNLELELKEQIEYQDIKLNYLLFAREYLKFFNEFRKLFKENNQTKELIRIHSIHSIRLLDLFAILDRTQDFGKYRAKLVIENYIGLNYYELIDFFDLCLAIFSE